MDLGISLVNFMPKSCVCGIQLKNDSYNAMHWRDCIKTRSRAVRSCHDRIKMALATFSRESLIPTHVEPYNFQDQHHKRPDLEMMFSDGSVLVDVATTNPLAASHRTGAAKTHFDAAKKKEILKTKRYSGMAVDEAATFFPFVMEVFGAMAPTSISLLSRIVKQARDNGVALSRSSLIDRLAVSLVRGNAWIIRQGAINTRNFAVSGVEFFVSAPRHMMRAQKPSPRPLMSAMDLLLQCSTASRGHDEAVIGDSGSGGGGSAGCDSGGGGGGGGGGES
jgi:hypothetical protein